MKFIGKLINRASQPANKRFVLALAACLVGYGATTISSARAEDGVVWTRQVNKGLDTAKQNNKYVLADVYTDWCGWCKRLDATTFSDKSVSEYLGSKFVCIKVNAEDHGEGQKLAQKYDIHAFPYALVFDRSGKCIGQFAGFLPPEQYQAKVEEIVGNASSEPAKN